MNRKTIAEIDNVEITGSAVMIVAGNKCPAAMYEAISTIDPELEIVQVSNAEEARILFAKNISLFAAVVVDFSGDADSKIKISEALEQIEFIQWNMDSPVPIRGYFIKEQPVLPAFSPVVVEKFGAWDSLQNDIQVHREQRLEHILFGGVYARVGQNATGLTLVEPVEKTQSQRQEAALKLAAFGA